MVAYGNYNDLVLQAAAGRNQTIIMWDFECVSSSSVKGELIDLGFSYISSGDSTGSTPAQSQAAYDAFINTNPRPSTLLPLNHETYSKFVFNNEIF